MEKPISLIWILLLATGLFYLDINTATAQSAPPNDLCINAEVIPTGVGNPLNPNFCNNQDPVRIIVDITDATATDNPNETCDVLEAPISGNEPGVWYQFTAPFSTEVEISTNNPGTNFDTENRRFFEGSDCANLTCVTSNDDGFWPGQNLSFKANFEATSSTTYHIYLFGYQGATGTAEMTISCNNRDEPCLLGGPRFSLNSNWIEDFSNAPTYRVTKRCNVATLDQAIGESGFIIRVVLVIKSLFPLAILAPISIPGSKYSR